jgi:EAL domain-containing protein (putative c-di-GMP-specific phosphodiesterase class I)
MPNPSLTHREGYHEILTRLVSDGDVMNPAHFIPVIAQFNLSTRFDMQVIETLAMDAGKPAVPY